MVEENKLCKGHPATDEENIEFLKPFNNNETDILKIKNPIYNSLLGDFDQKLSPITNDISKTEYQRRCLYGRLKLSYSKIDLKDNWVHRSIHWNNVNNGGVAWNFHIAYRNKYPFIKIGFDSIKDLFKYR